MAQELKIQNHTKNNFAIQDTKRLAEKKNKPDESEIEKSRRQLEIEINQLFAKDAT